MSLRDIYEDGYDEDDDQPLLDRTCPECDGDVYTDGGESVCDDCGLVIDEYLLDHRDDWSYTEDDELTRTRTGAPLTPTRHDRGLSSEIGRYRDAQGNVLSGKTRTQFARLRTHHSRARYRSKAEQNLVYAFGEIDRLCGVLDLPETSQERASDLYRRAADADLIRGRSIELMAAGSVYAACRCSGHAVTEEELAAVSTCSATEVRQGYHVLNRELDLPTPVPRADDIVARLCSAFDVSSEIRGRAVELVALAREHEVTNGRSPRGVAAGAVYCAALEKEAPITQSAIARKAGTTPPTLLARVREFEELGVELPE